MGVSSSISEGVVADLLGGGDIARLGGRALLAWAAIEVRVAGPTTTAGVFMTDCIRQVLIIYLNLRSADIPPALSTSLNTPHVDHPQVLISIRI